MSNVSYFEPLHAEAREEKSREQVKAWIERGKSERFTLYTYIGPDEASVLLEFSKGNVRRESRAKIAAYARDMSANGWKVTDQSMGFDVDGTFVNGHHRCKAVILSGATVQFGIALCSQGHGRRV